MASGLQRGGAPKRSGGAMSGGAKSPGTACTPGPKDTPNNQVDTKVKGRGKNGPALRGGARG